MDQADPHALAAVVQQRSGQQEITVQKRMINIYLLISIMSPLFAFLLTVLVSTNQIYILYGLGVTNEITYAFFLTLSLVLYHRSKRPFVYLLFGLLFLLRYESIVIPISVFAVEYFSKKGLINTKNILLAFVPIILWLLIRNNNEMVSL